MTSIETSSSEKAMTSLDFENLASAHWAGKNSWDELSPAEHATILENRELVRQQCVAEYSSNPLWQKRSEGNPDYWKNFSVGRHNL